MNWFKQGGMWWVWIDDPTSPTGRCGPFCICYVGDR
jgi:hypothetical protein